jgi:hypothetical protein
MSLLNWRSGIVKNYSVDIDGVLVHPADTAPLTCHVKSFCQFDDYLILFSEEKLSELEKREISSDRLVPFACYIWNDILSHR